MTSAAIVSAVPQSPNDWGSREHVHMLVMLVLTAIALYLCYRMTVPFLSALAWALALTVLVLPFHRLLEARLKMPGVAAAISMFAAAITVVAPVVLVSSSLISEAAGGAQLVQTRVESGEWRQVLATYPKLAQIVDWGDRQFDLPGSIKSASGRLSEFASDFVQGSVRQAVVLLLTFYLLFYYLRDRHLALKSIRYLSPLSNLQMQSLYRRVGDTLHATLYGTLAVAIVQGALGGLMFWWLGLPAPLLWGVVMGLLAVIPVLGAFVIWVPAALFLLVTGSPGKALALATWGTVVVGGIDNLLYPMLVGTRIHLHTVLVFISIVGGLFVFGAAGLILGPVILTVTVALLEIWRHPDQDLVLTPVVVPVAISSDAPGNGEVLVR